MDVIIPDDLFPYFEICGTRKNYAPGEMIRPEAQNNERLYLVESGRVRVYCSNASGRELTLRIMGKGRLIGEDVFVEFTGAKTAVSAVNEVTVVSCSVEELFPYIVESEALLRAILRHLTGTNISLTRHLKRIAIYDSRQKVASYLYEETREDSPSLIPIPLSSTVIQTTSSSFQAFSRIFPPACVYFIEFVRIFRITCCILSLSPII